MGMTTLLTLASMFGSLTNVTPPISYHTKLDIWMVSCIVFVFCTLAEFTLVIILKYYLPHLPLNWFHKLCLKATTDTPPSSAVVKDGTQKRSHVVGLDGKQAWVSNHNNIRQRTVTPVLELPNQNRNKVNGHDANASMNVAEIDDDEESITEEELLDDRKEMAEKVIKLIDKYSVIVFFISFSIFIGVYWYKLLHYFYNR